MSSARLYLLRPGELGVTLVEDGVKRTLEMGFSTPDGLEQLLRRLPLEDGDCVGMRCAPGGEAWQDALEALAIQSHPGVLPLTHELAPKGDGDPTPDATRMDLYYFIDHGVDAVACAPALPKGAPPGAQAFPLPEGSVYALRLLAARPGGPPWMFDAQAGCAYPGPKELARSTLCMMPVNLEVSADRPADFLVDFKPGGEIELTLRASDGQALQPLARRVIPTGGSGRGSAPAPRQGD